MVQYGHQDAFKTLAPGAFDSVPDKCPPNPALTNAKVKGAPLCVVLTITTTTMNRIPDDW